MTWAVKKRFWSDVSVTQERSGFAVALDERVLRTPAKARLVVPSAEVADRIAAEWRSVKADIRPEEMPVTRWANSAIDKVAPQFEDVVSMLAAYAETDLLCYRADGPAALVARQEAAWDPLLSWAETRYGATLCVTKGLLPVAQCDESISRLACEVSTQTPFQVAAFHDLVTLPGSLLIGLAVKEGRLTPQDAWAAAHLDENWQTEQWGIDTEAEKLRSSKFNAFSVSAEILAMVS